MTGREVALGDGGWRRYVVGEASGVRAVAPLPDLGLRLVVDGAEITDGDLRLVDLRAEGDGLAWRREGDGLAVEGRVEVAGDVARTWLTVRGRGRLQRVEPERWAAAGATALGQPVLGEGWFAALEHPGAEGPALALDVDLGEAAYQSPPLAVGRARPGEERTALWDELDRVRARPPRLVVLANNWYQLGYAGRMDEATVAAELAGFGRVADRHGLRLDWYCLDDPWDGGWEAGTGLWGRLDPRRFPGGLKGLQRAADVAGAGGIGLWVSPWGGYMDRHDFRVAWGGEHGFEVEHGAWPRLCPAGTAYSRHLAEAMRGFTAAGVGYWKIDGVQFDCGDRAHGHPTGPGGRTAQMDRFAALLDGVRAADPDAVLTFTTGSNPSPWWLRHADFIWRGGLDDAAPDEYDGGRHERFATYIDSCLDVLRPTAVPVSAIVTFSLVENGARAYRDEGEGPGAWARHCWLLAGRGTHHHDLYVAPDSLSGDEWGVLAAALAWARQNERVLARSRMVGGRPQAGEPYAFLSTAGGEVIVCARNPAARPQALTLELRGAVAWLDPVWGRHPRLGGPGGRHQVRFDLEPFEVVVAAGRLA